jgi:hypothetical protein
MSPEWAMRDEDGNPWIYLSVGGYISEHTDFGSLPLREQERLREKADDIQHIIQTFVHEMFITKFGPLRDKEVDVLWDY